LTKPFSPTHEKTRKRTLGIKTLTSVQRFLPKISWSCAMQNERRDFDQDDLAEIWRSAQHRRSEDLGRWLLQYFERQRLIKATEDRPQYVDARAAR